MGYNRNMKTLASPVMGEYADFYAGYIQRAKTRGDVLAALPRQIDGIKFAFRVGTASGYPVSARALIYMLVGHVDHHLASLHEKYLR